MKMVSAAKLRRSPGPYAIAAPAPTRSNMDRKVVERVAARMD